MNELFKILGLVALDNAGAIAALDETTERAEKSQGLMSKAFETIGKAAVAAGKVVATGLGATATAIGAVAKQSLDSYAEYEQLVGGVDTLFKDSSKKVQEYADKAYETAGMSANAYMETVTSFSASLLQSLDGDTAKAADKANRAIIDMSDNANKMGTDISMIQNAYQGFAKQNYTMLDNLKLGYGGTKEEMERLIADAAAMKDVQEELGVTIDASSMSFANIVDAISVVQKKMGIMDATADEAKGTIEGSTKAMKAAWTNLLTGLGDENADLSGLMDKFVNSVITMGNNIIPRIKLIFNGISKAVGKLMPKLSEQLPSLLQDLLPGLIEGAVALFNGLVEALPTLIQILIEQVPYIVTQISQGLMNAAPKLLATIKQIFGQIWDFISLELLNTGVSFEDAMGVFSDVWTTVGQPVVDAINGAITWVGENWDSIVATMEEAFSNLWTECQFVWEAIGQPIWDMIEWAIDWAVGLFQQHMPEIQAFFDGAVAGIKDTWENHLKPAFDAIGTFLKEVLMPVFEWVFLNVIEPYVEAAFTHIANLWNNTLKPVFDGICDFITGVFTGDFEKAFGGLQDIVDGVFAGIKSAIETPMNAAKEIVTNIISAITKAFNVKWELPKIKMPHFSITPKGWEFGDLLKGSIPKLGIEWYAKGGVLTQPTIFGMNGNNAMIGGEAGAEAVAPIDVLQGYVADAVASQNAGLVDVLDRILDAILAMDENMGGNLRDALDGTALKVGEREFARLVNKSVSRTQANELRVGGAYV